MVDTRVFNRNEDGNEENIVFSGKVTEPQVISK